MRLVAEQDRERVALSLRRHYAVGRLTVEELSERTELALRARTSGELRSALRDLPSPWSPGELRPLADSAARFAARAFLLCLLASVWSVLSFALLIAFVVVLAADASTAVELAIPALWALVTYLLWRAWRRPPRRVQARY